MTRIVGVAAVLLTLIAGHAAGQRITGQVVEQGGGPGVQAAFVTLLGADGARIRAFLSDASGRFHFDNVVAGRYVLRSERIGHTTTTLAIDVPEHGLSVRLEVPTAAIALDAIEVQGDERCAVRPNAAVAAARIWDEARKSLEIARFAAAAGNLTFRSSRYVRELEPYSLDVRSERIRPNISAGTRSFRPVDLDVLDTVGFISTRNDSLEFYGLDADVLLSDQFLDHHCFEAVSGGSDRPDHVGLRFRPVPERRLPEIEGTLWLNARSSALVQLEYRYVQADAVLPLESATGRVDFGRTAAGLIYVDRWYIRMPRVVENQGRRRLTGWVEEGGVVQGIGGATR